MMINMYQPSVSPEAIKAVARVLGSGKLAQGEQVERLEREMAGFCQVKRAVAVNSGTAALHTALEALGIGPGDEVIVPAFSFVATANAVLMNGAEPVLAEIDPKTCNLDPMAAEKLIGPKTKAIVAVNLYGYSADWDTLAKLAKAYNLKLVEDAAQSVGAKFKGRMSGSLADIGCFSFYATKNLMAGEGGMATTNKKYLAERMGQFRHHGQDARRRYRYWGLGYNYRMTEMQAVLLLDQLTRLPKEAGIRRQLAKRLARQLEGVAGIELMTYEADREHVYHQFTIRVKPRPELNRDRLIAILAKQGIQTGVYYPKPLYAARHLANYRRGGRELKHTERACQEVLSLPIHPYLSKAEIDQMAEVIRKASQMTMP